jgi:hypothetical protein
MCSCQIKSIIEIIQSVLTCLGILGAGLWALYLYLRQRENYPRIEFTADIIFHKKIGDWWILELIAFVENKGKVQHRIYKFKFDLASLNLNDKVNISEDFGGQVYFPNNITKGSFLPSKYKFFFIEPGVKGKYSYITRIPCNAEAVNFHTWFDYPVKRYLSCPLIIKLCELLNYKILKYSHTAEATKSIPDNL